MLPEARITAARAIMPTSWRPAAPTGGHVEVGDGQVESCGLSRMAVERVVGAHEAALTR